MPLDLKKELEHLYNPSAKQPAIVDVPAMNFLMIDGAGDPRTAQGYRDAVQALYSLSYALKFLLKKGEGGVDYAVLPLEGLWWADDMAGFSLDRRGDWRWTMMIAQPEWITADLVQAALAQVARKRDAPVALPQIRFEAYHEGLSAQIMHIGPYAAEAPTIAALHQFIHEQGYALRGKHHEIYLGDPNKTQPENLKTVIRQPVAPAS
ncbi:MAG: GyrI-like domain-containing protein [Anaerolineae bacterium]|nr:GyrI-like domain-containing protein [Anaerolineae bacterium]